ncbi:unnamed protein product [Cuscuta campestris]|uniref:Uncharacterized protein n=1 Tax=Cuscuta campestris TaxID=132261 RepID=A0A484JZ59_9ASTE|nr:unnamed protein product [Cuscuta campestris]
MEGTKLMLWCFTCVNFTILYALQNGLRHYFSWKKPKEQSAILVIIFMAPLYAVVSYIGLMDSPESKMLFTFLKTVKECYEALVIAKFLGLMYTYLNMSTSENIVPDEIKGREIHHSFPVTLFQPRTVQLDDYTLKQLKDWTWQFVVIRPVCSISMTALQILGAYPAWVGWTFTTILNISVLLAFYSLVVFNHTFAKELAPYQPYPKFFYIKGIVFFCFWQGIALKILAALGIIKSHYAWLDVEDIPEALQNILVLAEMHVLKCFLDHGYTAEPYRCKATVATGTAVEKKD